MKKKSVLGTVLTLGVAGLMMTACSTANAATSGAQLTFEAPSVAMASATQTNIV